ncbi:pheromone-dependent cell cycle arrest protein-like protein Far11 [Calycina marina]|uniref:Pheromone-dependent cell cycle arrest protein-like protein Far11 n=1 Tax=Calycina marina TaxID=1763456 RepID=A0A9P8CCU1_9HELO|nr:pheromone-dependent cell cycle arrest protein-like protein Far11 [Calycina marina]
MKGTASGLGSLFPRTSAASTLLPGDNPVYEDAPDVADTGLADVGLPAPNPPAPITVGVPMGRPQLARNQDQPPPQSQPRPPPPPNQIGNPQDSLSLMQLRRIVNEFPKSDMLTYAFEYEDTAAFEEEVNEWFSYNSAEYTRLIGAKETFQRRWRKVSEQPWIDSNSEERRGFMQKEVDKLLSQQLRRRCKALQSLLHVILGVWDETAGLTKEEKPRTSDKKVAPEEQSPKDTQANWDKMKASSQQLKHMQFGIEALVAVGGIKFLFRVMQNAFQRFWDDDYRETQLVDEDIPFIQDELDNLTTIFYVIIEGTRKSPEYHSVARAELLALKPGLLEYFVTITAKLRWDEANELPQTRIFLLFWKTILLTLGGTNEVDKVKWATDELANLKLDGAKKITASPLDYHIFRQEITSKYPAYIPPQPLFPLEPENNSILPPLPNRPSRTNGANGIITPAMNINSSGTSILHQPVHIATPAPSPPPSPPVGGKAGKKQNYQTNQNFPFMYPPLDSTSNTAGGKGLAGLQGSLVGRKWEGSEIPKSILEAGTLFAERMRMTRAMRQLWDERERFLKFERGWGVDENNDVEELELDTILSKKFQLKSTKRMKPKIDYGPSRTVESGIKSKLDLVENFYQESIPHFQSLVIVLLKAVLANVTALITQPTGGQQGGLPSYRSEPNLRAGGVGQPMNRQQDPANIPLPNTVEPTDLPIEEVEALRSREIIAKAVSGILLILLKWFKVSHILKFEYFTQLLLDSNYLPLVLKLFAHQDVDKIIDSNTNRDDASFFQFCNLNSNHAPAAEPEEPGEESDDDASPPPIKMTRKAPQTASDEEDQLPALAFQDGKTEGRGSPQELDDMEYMIKEASAEPITDYSWRNFFSSINFLRIMQKICKNKAHRNLLLVQYKSSNILKKALKIPQPELRLYTLKLFKNQVPYCGRKWRQTNMRVITAVYLHCRPELRDDWLAGSDVDADVEEALPLEQALRALTHWHNIKRYPDQIGADTKLLEEEHDFFVRELERMEWIEDSIEGDSVDGWENNMGNW